MLELENLELGYTAFDLRADLSVQTGSRVALLGPSGAGKSTLLAAIAGFLRPRSGRILLNGRDITHLPPVGRDMAVIFQDQNLFPHMNVVQNVGLSLSPRLRLDADQMASTQAALERVGLFDLGHRRPGELSGGQQARVALARVSLQRKSLILLDEPFAALGPALTKEMLDLVAQICTDTGAGLLMVTHDPAAALHLCDETIVVADGECMKPAPTAKILADPPRALAEYLGK